MEREIERPNDLYMCVICGVRFDSREELEQHESKCANKKPAS